MRLWLIGLAALPLVTGCADLAKPTPIRITKDVPAANVQLPGSVVAQRGADGTVRAVNLQERAGLRPPAGGLPGAGGRPGVDPSGALIRPGTIRPPGSG